jgi:hypothetical protein
MGSPPNGGGDCGAQPCRKLIVLGQSPAAHLQVRLGGPYAVSWPCGGDPYEPFTIIHLVVANQNRTSLELIGSVTGEVGWLAGGDEPAISWKDPLCEGQ